MKDKLNERFQYKIFPFVLIVLGLVVFLHVANEAGWMSLMPEFLMGMRFALIAVLVLFGWLRSNLTTWVFISMLIGIEIGIDFSAFGKELKVFGDIFLRLIKTIIAPLLFGTLVVGIAGHASLKQIGRMGLKAIVYFEIVTTIALFIGLAAINISKAGEGIVKPDSIAMPDQLKKATESHFEFVNIFPENFAKAIADNQVLQIVIFSILFAIALSMVEGHHKEKMINFCESLNEVMFKFTNLVMYFSPFAVGGAIAYTVSTMGLGIFRNFGLLILTLFGALVVFIFLVLFPIALYFKVPVRKFLSAIHEPVSVAFATASSDAALPKAIKSMQVFGVSKKVSAFVLPLGYSFNLDGTTLYLSLATIFVAQAGGVDLSWSAQFVILISLMLSSKGVAGVAKASFVILYGTVAMFKLPEWPVFLIFGADAIMDMARTSVNVIGNCLATVIIAKSEGEFTEQES